MAARYTLSTGERLKREADIEALFRTGKAFSLFPLRVIWRLIPRSDAPFAIQAGFSAPKKGFRQAVDRNRVKRLLREAWRLQKPALEAVIPAGQQLHVFLLFTDKVLPEWLIVQSSVGKAIARLQQALQNIIHA